MGRPIARGLTGGIAAALLAGTGCGGADDAGRPAGEDGRILNIHVSANLRGYGDGVRAGQLAVQDAGGRAGRFRIRVVVHDEASSQDDNTDPDRVRRNAEKAARDPSAIAYVGDVNSGSTAISAPILNRAGLLQVTPTSTYVGLTRSEGAAPGEPEVYRPSGRRTLARVVPADHAQARAGIVYAREMRVKRLGVAADESLYGQGLAKLVLAAARDLDLDAVSAGKGGSLEAQARRLRAAGADALYVAACAPPGDLIDLAEAHGDAKLFTGDCYVSLNSDISRPVPHLDGRFFVTGPGGGLEHTPAGGRWFKRWRELVGTVPDEKLLFSYEAVAAVLAAIERAGPRGGDRASVVREFFATRDRESILGRYSIDAHGDTTLRSYGGFAIRDGRLRFDRVLDTGG